MTDGSYTPLFPALCGSGIIFGGKYNHEKLVAFLITVAFAFALAACGNPGGDADPTGTPFKATPSPDPKEDQGEKSALKVRMRYAEGTEGMTYYMIYHL